MSNNNKPQHTLPGQSKFHSIQTPSCHELSLTDDIRANIAELHREKSALMTPTHTEHKNQHKQDEIEIDNNDPSIIKSKPPLNDLKSELVSSPPCRSQRTKSMDTTYGTQFDESKCDQQHDYDDGKYCYDFPEPLPPNHHKHLFRSTTTEEKNDQKQQQQQQPTVEQEHDLSSKSASPSRYLADHQSKVPLQHQYDHIEEQHYPFPHQQHSHLPTTVNEIDLESLPPPSFDSNQADSFTNHSQHEQYDTQQQQHHQPKLNIPHFHQSQSQSSLNEHTLDHVELTRKASNYTNFHSTRNTKKGDEKCIKPASHQDLVQTCQKVLSTDCTSNPSKSNQKESNLISHSIGNNDYINNQIKSSIHAPSIRSTTTEPPPSRVSSIISNQNTTEPTIQIDPNVHLIINTPQTVPSTESLLFTPSQPQKHQSLPQKPQEGTLNSPLELQIPTTTTENVPTTSSSSLKPSATTNIFNSDHNNNNITNHKIKNNNNNNSSKPNSLHMMKRQSDPFLTNLPPSPDPLRSPSHNQQDNLHHMDEKLDDEEQYHTRQRKVNQRQQPQNDVIYSQNQHQINQTQSSISTKPQSPSQQQYIHHHLSIPQRAIRSPWFMQLFWWLFAASIIFVIIFFLTIHYQYLVSIRIHQELDEKQKLQLDPDQNQNNDNINNDQSKPVPIQYAKQEESSWLPKFGPNVVSGDIIPTIHSFQNHQHKNNEEQQEIELDSFDYPDYLQNIDQLQNDKLSSSSITTEQPGIIKPFDIHDMDAEEYTDHNSAREIRYHLNRNDKIIDNNNNADLNEIANESDYQNHLHHTPRTDGLL